MSEGAAARSMNPPSGLIRLRDGSVAVRRSGFLLPGEHPECPFHHRVDAAINLHEGAMTITCRARLDGPRDAQAARHRLECGALLIVATSAFGPFWCDVTAAEDTYIKQNRMKPTDIARFLGIHFPK